MDGIQKTVVTAACVAVCEKMRASPNDRDVQLDSCNTITNLSKHGKDILLLLGKNGACEVVVAAAKAFPEDRDIQYAAFCAVAKLAFQCSPNRDLLVNAGACEAVIAAARAIPVDDREAHRAICMAIQGLSTSSTILNRLAHAGAFDIVCEAAKAHRFESDIQFAACTLVALLAVSDPGMNAELLFKARAFALVRSAAEVFPQDLRIQSTACMAFRNLTFNAAFRPLVITDETCELVIKSALQFPLDRYIQFQACSVMTLVFQTFGTNISAMSTKNRAFEVMCEASKTFPSDQPIQRVVCIVTGVLASDMASNRELLVRKRAVLMVCEAAKAFRESGDRDIQYTACLMIMSMASECSSRNNEACEVICTAARMFPKDRDLQCAACHAMTSLFEASSTNKDHLVRNGVCEILCSAAKEFPEDRSIQMLACGLTSILSHESPQNKARLLRAGVLDVLCAAAEQFPNDQEMQIVVCSAMKTLLSKIHVDSRVTSNDIAVHGDKICRVVSKAAGNFRSSKEIQSSACQVIANVAAIGNPEPLGKVGACTEVCAIANAFPEDRHIQYSVCSAIVNLSQNSPTNKQLLIKSGASKIVCAAARRFPENHDIKLSACVAIASLSSDGHWRTLSQDGACEVVTSWASWTNKTYPTVQMQACRAIKELVGRAGNRDAPIIANMLIQHGAGEAVCRAAKTFPKNPDIQTEACDAIGNLAFSGLPMVLIGGPVAEIFGDGPKKLFESGACDVICEAARAFPKIKDVQRAVCHAVAQLVGFFSDSCREGLGGAGACEVVCKAAKTFKNDGEFQNSVCIAISNMIQVGPQSIRERLVKAGALDVVKAASTAFPNAPDVKNAERIIRERRLGQVGVTGV